MSTRCPWAILVQEIQYVITAVWHWPRAWRFTRILHGTHSKMQLCITDRVRDDSSSGTALRELFCLLFYNVNTETEWSLQRGWGYRGGLLIDMGDCLALLLWWFVLQVLTSNLFRVSFFSLRLIKAFYVGPFCLSPGHICMYFNSFLQVSWVMGD